MSEEFRIYCTLGYGTAVDSYILTMLADTVCMYYFREKLLTHTTLSCNENGEVSFRYLYGRINSPEQNRVVSDNPELLFCPLYL